MSEERGERDHAAGGFERSAVGRLVIRCEEVFFTLLLGALLVAGLLPIVLRLLDLPGVNWANPLSRQLVLWVALFGASAATRDRKHISIDAVGHVLPQRGRLALRAATGLFSAVVCGLLAVVAARFARDEASLGGGAIAFLGIPKAWLPAVIPAGLSLITLRFLLAAGFDAWAALRRLPGDGRE